VSGVSWECGAGWRWGGPAGPREGWGHIKFGGCRRWGGGAAGGGKGNLSGARVAAASAFSLRLESGLRAMVAHVQFLS
jgi:hypothetical protein